MFIMGGNKKIRHVDSEELLSRLTRIVVNISDASVVDANKELSRVKHQLDTTRSNLDSIKRDADSKIKLYNKTKIKLDIVKQIDSMRQEGIIVGDNKLKILKILTHLDDQSERQLLKIKDVLDVYVPVPDKISFQ